MRAGSGSRIQSPRLEIGRGGIALKHERSAVANQRHRGSQGVPIVLLSAVAVFAVALTWRLTIGNQPQRAAGDLGNLVAEHYRQRGDVVEFLPDPAAGTVELMVLVKGRRRVVLCVAGGREVTPPVVRELVGTQRIEHADDATLVSTGIGTESALNLATEQAVQWVGPDELESWMKLRNAP